MLILLGDTWQIGTEKSVSYRRSAVCQRRSGDDVVVVPIVSCHLDRDGAMENRRGCTVLAHPQITYIGSGFEVGIPIPKLEKTFTVI